MQVVQLLSIRIFRGEPFDVRGWQLELEDFEIKIPAAPCKQNKKQKTKKPYIISSIKKTYHAMYNKCLSVSGCHSLASLLPYPAKKVLSKSLRSYPLYK